MIVGTSAVIAPLSMLRQNVVFGLCIKVLYWCQGLRLSLPFLAQTSLNSSGVSRFGILLGVFYLFKYFLILAMSRWSLDKLRDFLKAKMVLISS